MPRARYQPVANPATTQEAAVRQMEDAFDVSDDEDDVHSSAGVEDPLMPASATAPSPSGPPLHARSNSSNNLERRGGNGATSGLYDFEHDYTLPPPGSPPRPSALALPNNIFDNTNGIVPSGSTGPSASQGPSWFRRTLGDYIPGLGGRQRGPVGSGLQNDGVFANLVSKPTAPVNSSRGNANGASGADGEGGSGSNVHVAPEFEQKEVPPTYAEAQQDAVPPYWDTTVLAPAGMGDELIIEGMSPGHVFSFITSFFISFSFQFIGFMLTSILAATHAAKFGSRAGLGITLVQYGFYLRQNLRDAQLQMASPEAANGWAVGSEPHPTFSSAEDADAYYSSKLAATPTSGPGEFPEIPSLGGAGDYGIPQEVTVATDWLSFFLMTVGWLIFLTSLLGFWRVKRWERSLRQTNVPQVVGGTPSGPGSELERPMVRFLRGGMTDMGHIFTRLNNQSFNSASHGWETRQQRREREMEAGTGEEIAVLMPNRRLDEEEEVPARDPTEGMSMEERRRYEAAMLIDRRIENELRRAGLL